MDLESIAPWAALSDEQRQHRLEQARLRWPGEWNQLSDEERQTAARLLPLVLADEGQVNPKTYRCPICFDRVLVSGSRAGVFWYCGCAAGIAAEAGYWYDHLFEKKGRKIIVIERVRDAFHAYLRTRGDKHGIAIRDGVNRLAETREAKLNDDDN